jgi:ADP-ribose pyrophosphatase YjhB (NUDIX family)
MTRTALDFDENWLEPDEIAHIRRRMPLPYVHGVPVKLGDDGSVEKVGLLLRTLPDGVLGREIVGGRVRYHESIRSALLRHAEKDLGTLALPTLPVALTPFHIAEYFPTEGTSRYVDPRQHAIALCYILPVIGECEPRRDALALDWLTPAEAVRADVVAEMVHGQEHIVRAALAHLGLLP